MRTKTQNYINFHNFFQLFENFISCKLVSNCQRFQIVNAQPNGLDNLFFKSHETMAAIIGDILFFLQSKN